MALLMTPLNAT